MAVYYATKAYVLSFSEALHHELRPRGVRVTALCPGPVPTEFQARAGITDDITPDMLTRSAERVAERGLSRPQRGRRVVVPGLLNKLRDDRHAASAARPADGGGRPAQPQAWPVGRSKRSAAQAIAAGAAGSPSAGRAVRQRVSAAAATKSPDGADALAALDRLQPRLVGRQQGRIGERMPQMEDAGGEASVLALHAGPQQADQQVGILEAPAHKACVEAVYASRSARQMARLQARAPHQYRAAACATVQGARAAGAPAG